MCNTAGHRLACVECILCFLLASILPFPQAGAQSMRTISTKDGLPQSFISGLVQDDSAFIWIATRNGLVRFDGMQYRLFQHRPDDTASLASNVIIWLRRDPQNHLWIEHESGVLDEMDPATEKITHFLKGGMENPIDVSFIRRGWLVDRDGLFWGITQGHGLNTFDRNKQVRTDLTRANAGIISDTVRGLTETRDHFIWVVTQGGISRYDKNGRIWSHWTDPFKEVYGNFPNSDAITIDVHERANGELMWGDRGNVYFFHPQTHQFRKVKMPSLSYFGVRWIRTGPDSVDYFESFGRLYRYDDASGIAPLGKTIADDFGDIKSFLIDGSGILWLGTNAHGIRQIDLRIPYFRSFPYKKQFLADLLDNEWHLDMAALFDWKPADNQFTDASYQFRWAYDEKKRLFLSLKNTIGYIDPKGQEFNRLPRPPLDARITGITITGTGMVVVAGTTGDIFTYDAQSGKWQPLLDTGQLRREFGTSIRLLDILADDRYLWLSTEKDGLFSVAWSNRAIRHFQRGSAANPFPVNEPLGLRTDPLHPDVLWVGSFQGLIRMDKNTLQYKVFSMKEGLPDQTIYSILSDPRGYLWFSTNRGICRLEPTTGEIRIFGTQHGLPGDEFNRFHGIRLSEGRLAFGSTDGWTVFDPAMVQHDDFEPRVALTGLKINNKDVNPAAGKILRSPLNSAPQLTLPYDQNTITVGFAGLEFSQPQALHYRYRLEGYDNDWIRADASHQATYTKIPPGHYTLWVNASNTSGKWSGHVKSIALNIRSPWWSTPMAYLCYSIILAGLIWTFIRIRVSRLTMQREVRLKAQETSQLKELDDMKTRFFANITHEFRTPLTLIIGPAEQLKTEFAADPRIKKTADRIIANSQRLLTLVNRLMELAKLESGASKLVEQRGNPASAVGLVIQSFETYAQTRAVKLSFEAAGVPADCLFYADALERIIYNLVSNALKFTLPGGNVSVTLEAREQLLLTVKDTGIGIPEDRLPRIFDRYYQVTENSSLVEGTPDAGTGLGLAMVKELVGQMGGAIDVESRTGPVGGTAFILSLPFRPVSSAAFDDAAADEAPEAADGLDKKMQILVVEDSMELAGFIAGILSEDYEVLHALDGSTGLKDALSTIPDLVISDVMMPVMDGIEFCRRIRADARTNHIPVILLTAKASQEDRMAGLAEGANDYLTKPFHPGELLLRVRNLLDLQKKWQEKNRSDLSRPADFEKPKQAEDVFLTRLYALLDENLDDAGFGVDQLQELVGMSRSSLHRKLKSVTGLSTTEVIRNFRLSRGAAFLRQGYNSSEAAYKSGFGSPAYFTKCFREAYGVTPTEFIRQLKS
jgi:signal transduction histidine kinase/DNA-binding response OmpR family regulator/ligand-binding sensor domain-containing protein